MKIANYELQIKRIWGSILKMPNYELNEVRIKRDQSVPWIVANKAAGAPPHFG